ncbi:MAG: phosphoenolpyruvate--protein phosphotransferase [Gemmataceae bacterium]
MEIKKGIAVSPGVAIGPAFLLDAEGLQVRERFIAPGSYPRELERLENALRAAADDARREQARVAEKMGTQYAAIFAAHAMMIEDPGFRQEIQSLIRDQGYTAEYAVSRVVRRRIKKLESLEDAYLAARSSDLLDLQRRILRHLVGEQTGGLGQLSHPIVLLAHDLTPSQTAQLDRQKVRAFATEAGGRASHTAIMAGVLEIPAVVGLGRFLADVSPGDLVIVDGNRGLLILDPDEETREAYERTRKSFVSLEKSLLEEKDLPAVTRDGVRVLVFGNIEFPAEAAHCVERGAEGVGLYRTEFLYLDKKEDPSESEHFEAYLQVVRVMGSRPVVIRTLDLGADKFSGVVNPATQERNPFLGVRSIRLCLRNLSLFKTQIRAILRASAFGDVRLMFPMISTLMELRQAKMILADVMDDLQEQGIAFNRQIPVGTMIEVPSAAIMAPELAREVSFFSIGTNDLIQYVLAADRTNENVADLYNAGDPAILRLLDYVIKAAQQAGVEVNVCGEMSGEPLYTMLLIGLGIRQLSVAPQNIPEIKRIIRSITVEEARRVAQEALELDNARDIKNLLRDRARRVIPEFFD